MREWALNSKNKSVYSYFGMINALRFKSIDILDNRNQEPFYVGDSECVYSPWISLFYWSGRAEELFSFYSINKG